MALWTFETSFEVAQGYNTGNLPGQDTWTLQTGNFTVSTAQAESGTQSALGNTTGPVSLLNNRVVADVNTNGSTFYFSVYVSNIATADTTGINFLGTAGADYLCNVSLNSPTQGKWQLSGATTLDQGAVLVQDSWNNRFGVEFDFGLDRFRGNYNNGTMSAYVGFSTTVASDIDLIKLAVDNGGAGDLLAYWDRLSASYASGPANLKSYNTNVKSNVKSIDTNTLANIKSLNTNV